MWKQNLILLCLSCTLISMFSIEILVLIHSVAKISTKPCKLRSWVSKFYRPIGPVESRFTGLTAKPLAMGHRTSVNFDPWYTILYICWSPKSANRAMTPLQNELNTCTHKCCIYILYFIYIIPVLKWLYAIPYSHRKCSLIGWIK